MTGAFNIIVLCHNKILLLYKVKSNIFSETHPHQKATTPFGVTSEFLSPSVERQHFKTKDETRQPQGLTGAI